MIGYVAEFVGCWAMAGILAYGVTFADFYEMQLKRFGEVGPEDMYNAYPAAGVMACLGPIGLAVALLFSDRHGADGVRWKL